MDFFGYEFITTFWEDFSIADCFGVQAVKDTYDIAFNEWKKDYKYLTELVMVLNHKIWQHYETNEELASLYDELWRDTEAYAYENLQGDELRYYFNVTD